ncbi:MAG: hypothetical protein EOO90_21810 [Pedobacter sp.]|nr:MAG: hypothetical protein EOO90_21810 [Pedobacter sp.]
MTKLTSKTQYKISEKGEFHNIAQRDLEETIALIIDYPWDVERSLATVELTCPSITIEHPIGSYLKIGPYFSGKFSLYYLGPGRKVHIKVASTLDEAVEWVRKYFNQQEQFDNFGNKEFKINPSAHFITNTFEYTTGSKALRSFFQFPLIMFPILMLFLVVVNFDHFSVHKFMVAFSIISVMLLIISSPYAFFYFNYLKFDKYKYLQISRGHEEFVFGTIDRQSTYYKKDVLAIHAYGLQYRKSAWQGCEVFSIEFKNGEQIYFTSLLIRRETLRKKFVDHTITDHHKFFPTIGNVGLLTSV